MKMLKPFLIAPICAILLTWSCSPTSESKKQEETSAAEDTFQVTADQFADLQILRYQVPGFDQLTTKQKELVYYLYMAALSGRDILYDQNYKHNLTIRKTIEAIVANYDGDRRSEAFKNFMTYAKRFWFSNGVHHHYSTIKFTPDVSEDYFHEVIHEISDENLPLMDGESKHEFFERITPIIFRPEVDSKRVNLESDIDNVMASVNNYYENISEDEVVDYYNEKVDPDDPRRVSYGLNSKLMKVDGEILEKTYKIGGMYSEALKEIVSWLEKASGVAENETQKKALDLLIEYFKTGDLRTFDEYNIAWVQDTVSTVDVINGFIEVYGDPLGYRGAYESVVSIKDFEASERLRALQENVQWFEDNSPLMDAHKKEEVKGISYKVINVVVESGDAAPSTPIGINLPNSQWIRKEYGSKAVSLGNIKNAYNRASSKGAIEEFIYGKERRKRAKEHGILASNLHTALHEVIGHASGQLEPGVRDPAETLKNYASALEEARADLVSLYFLTDQKLVDIGVMPTTEVGKTEYDLYIANGLMLQLRRLNEGENIEQAHMRNRQMVASWVYEKGKENNVIEKVVEDGKTYFVVKDYEKLRDLFGNLLREVQRIKSQGDFEAGQQLIENYGVKVDQPLLKEVKQRYEKLDYPPYSGFIQPKLIPEKEGDQIIDVKIEYPKDFVKQMMEYGEEFSFLPVYN